MTTMMASSLGGLIEDLERDDNDAGPEPEPDTGEGAIRTLLPYTPQLARITASAPDRAPFAGTGLQCDNCGGWFGVTYWTCEACKAIASQVRTLKDDNRQSPLRSTPHMRDGRVKSSAELARLHPHASRRPRLGDGRAP